MEKVKVIIEWASDGTISAMMEKDMFAGMGDTVKAAVADMKEGVALYIGQRDGFSLQGIFGRSV